MTAERIHRPWVEVSLKDMIRGDNQKKLTDFFTHFYVEFLDQNQYQFTQQGEIIQNQKSQFRDHVMEILHNHKGQSLSDFQLYELQKELEKGEDINLQDILYQGKVDNEGKIEPDSKNPTGWIFYFNLFLQSVFVFYSILFGLSMGSVAYCDGIGGVEGPPSPPVVRIPGEPLEAPELPPAPPLIPTLDQPLLSEHQRENELYRRFIINSIGEFPSLERISETVRVQGQIERQVEAAFIFQGFPPENIIRERHLLRGYLFYHRGRALSTTTYRGYLTEISRIGTMETRPYQRILQAIRARDIFL